MNAIEPAYMCVCATINTLDAHLKAPSVGFIVYFKPSMLLCLLHTYVVQCYNGVCAQ